MVTLALFKHIPIRDPASKENAIAALTRELLDDPEIASEGFLRVVSIISSISNQKIMMESALSLLKNALVRCYGNIPQDLLEEEYEEGEVMPAERMAFEALKEVAPACFCLACKFSEKIPGNEVKSIIANYLVELKARAIFDAADDADVRKLCALY